MGVLAVSLCLSACAGASAPAPLSEWLLAGSFDNPQDARLTCPGFVNDYLVDLGGERQAVLTKGGTAGGMPVMEAKADSGVLDFKKYLSPGDNAVAYAYTELDSPGGLYALRLGSDDGVRAWLNGVMILDDHSHRSLDPDSDAVPVELVKGRNRLLVKVDQGTGEWSMSCTLRPRADEEKALEKAGSVGLSIIPSRGAAAGSISFTVFTVPAFGVGVPVECIVKDRAGTRIAGLAGSTGEIFTLEVPAGSVGLCAVTATPKADALSAAQRGVLSGARETEYFVLGDVQAEYARVAAQARAAARTLDAAKDPFDLIPTLDLLADRLEDKLHPSLETGALKTKALGNALDIIARVSSGSTAPLTGYRQYAYRSGVDGSLQPYCLYLPQDFDPKKKYSLVLTLHGYSGDDDSGGRYLAALTPADFIIASPFGRGDMAYKSVGEQDVLDVMDRVMAAYPIDPDRVYLSGSSMGGLGTWTIGQLYPDRFAAIVPFCGWTGTELLTNLRNLPVFAIHGDADPTVPVDMDRAAVKELRRLGFSVRYDEIKGGNHSAWTGWSRTHDPSSIFDYMRSHVRVSSPSRITARVLFPRYGSFYWIRVDQTGAARGGVRVQAPGNIDAVRESKTSVRITTSGVDALTLDCVRAGLDTTARCVLSMDGTKIDIPQGASVVSLVRTDAGWKTEGPAPAGRARHAGGGMADVCADGMLVVYGTAAADRRAELEGAARRFADWTPSTEIPIGMKTGGFPVASDKSAVEQGLTGRNLLLIGSVEENLASRAFADVIRPYYSGGSVAVGGGRFMGMGLGLVFPNPRDPAHLVGYIDLPGSVHGDPSLAEQWFAYFSLRFRGYQVDQTASNPGNSPDVMVLSRNPISDTWSGWFDRNWENLSGQ